jgi:hypothetical protein
MTNVSKILVQKLPRQHFKLVIQVQISAVRQKILSVVFRHYPSSLSLFLPPGKCYDGELIETPNPVFLTLSSLVINIIKTCDII